VGSEVTVVSLQGQHESEGMRYLHCSFCALWALPSNHDIFLRIHNILSLLRFRNLITASTCTFWFKFLRNPPPPAVLTPSYDPPFAPSLPSLRHSRHNHHSTTRDPTATFYATRHTAEEVKQRCITEDLEGWPFGNASFFLFFFCINCGT
jgi:hypothetical protein